MYLFLSEKDQETPEEGSKGNIFFLLSEYSNEKEGKDAVPSEDVYLRDDSLSEDKEELARFLYEKKSEDKEDLVIKEEQDKKRSLSKERVESGQKEENSMSDIGFTLLFDDSLQNEPDKLDKQAQNLQESYLSDPSKKGENEGNNEERVSQIRSFTEKILAVHHEPDNEPNTSKSDKQITQKADTVPEEETNNNKEDKEEEKLIPIKEKEEAPKPEEIASKKEVNQIDSNIKVSIINKPQIHNKLKLITPAIIKMSKKKRAFKPIPKSEIAIKTVKTNKVIENKIDKVEVVSKKDNKAACINTPLPQKRQITMPGNFKKAKIKSFVPKLNFKPIAITKPIQLGIKRKSVEQPKKEEKVDCVSKASSFKVKVEHKTPILKNDQKIRGKPIINIKNTNHKEIPILKKPSILIKKKELNEEKEIAKPLANKQENTFKSPNTPRRDLNTMFTFQATSDKKESQMKQEQLTPNFITQTQLNINTIIEKSNKGINYKHLDSIKLKMQESLDIIKERVKNFVGLVEKCNSYNSCFRQKLGKMEQILDSINV